MPHVALDPIGAWPIAACIVDICAEQIVERILFKRADGLAEQPGADEEQEVSHDDEEDRERCATELVLIGHCMKSVTYLSGWQIGR